MTTILPEQIQINREEPPPPREVPVTENTTSTDYGPSDFLQEQELIARLLFAALEKVRIAEGYEVMGQELLEWSEVTLEAQAQTLPEE